LYSPLFGENPEVVECGNGKIIIIGIVPAIGRQYFVGRAKVPWDCVLDRFVLLTVGGHPAIAQLPHPACWGGVRMAVIQRFPFSGEPGILVSIDNGGRGLEDPAERLKAAAALAAQIMGVQP
jgi:hypothetical protein